jgi:hypothetical protein
MATNPPKPTDPQPDPFKQKYKTARDLLTDPNFHALEDMEVKRQLLGEIYPGFNEYDAATQDKDLSKGLKH